MTEQLPSLGRRSFLRITMFGLATLALTNPVRALAVGATASMSQLGLRIRESYPARAARLARNSNPRPWPHTRQRGSAPLLFVDNWLLPASVAQIVLDKPSDD